LKSVDNRSQDIYFLNAVQRLSTHISGGSCLHHLILTIEERRISNSPGGLTATRPTGRLIVPWKKRTFRTKTQE